VSILVGKARLAVIIADKGMHPGLVVSDCDGTLVDSKPGANTVWVEVAAE